MFTQGVCFRQLSMVLFPHYVIYYVIVAVDRSSRRVFIPQQTQYWAIFIVYLFSLHSVSKTLAHNNVHIVQTKIQNMLCQSINNSTFIQSSQTSF